MAQEKKAIRVLSFIIIVFIFLTGESEGAEELLLLEGLGESQKIEYKSENLRDPFQEERMQTEAEKRKKEKENLQTGQMPAAVKPLPSLQVQGIIWGSSLPQAIINNKVLKIGETIEEVQIMDIAKDKVTVFFENQQYNLSISTAVNPDDLAKSQEGGKYER